MDRQTSLSDLDDEVLMSMYIEGEERAFEIVYRRHRDQLRRFLGRQSRNEATGAELAQEVWMKLIRACENGNYGVEAKFTTFLYRIARNHLIDWYRKNGKVQSLELNNESDLTGEISEVWEGSVTNPEKILEDRANLDKVMEGIANLSEEQRMTLLMQLEGKMSYDDIAEATGTSRETVKTRLRYARAHLKKHMYGT